MRKHHPRLTTTQNLRGLNIMAKAIVRARKQRAAATEILSHNEAARAQFRASIGGGSAKDLLKKAQAALKSPALAEAISDDPVMVDVYRVARSSGGVKMTRTQARKEMAERAAAKKESEAEELRVRAEKLAEQINASAREDVANSLRGLLAVRDMLLSIEQGDEPFGFDDQRNAEVIGTFLMKHAATLERALFQLHAWEGEKFGKKAEAIFANDLFRIE